MKVTQRACSVLQSLEPGASASSNCEAMDLLVTGALQRRDYAASEGIAPHVAQQVSKGTPRATTIHTTLRAPLQRFAVQTLQTHLRELSGRHVEDGALVVLDNASGEVLAWVGSSGPLSNAADVDAVTALRQPGSTLKPFLYAQALAERRITAASLLEDSATQIQTTGGLTAREMTEQVLDNMEIERERDEQHRSLGREIQRGIRRERVDRIARGRSHAIAERQLDRGFKLGTGRFGAVGEQQANATAQRAVMRDCAVRRAAGRAREADRYAERGAVLRRPRMDYTRHHGAPQGLPLAADRGHGEAHC